MGLPNLMLGKIDVTATVKEFPAALHSINLHRETLVVLQRDQMAAERVFRDSLRDPAESWPR